ncbi:PilT protein domain protein (plasmid) [Haloterrigena turkmenica DSM 5511]|uniref:PilT protein domain protein n=1 Tax=Haloterrigena turkmenica (strain ATCC 51198 / DSM 5511 / JCM 9101 / NCIMB 13204 / VKM B-1734 / 4k) TaxID=543526 RepID=D2S2J6_HALTV|nr:type II toxin-antitoxin system VapC family toxin [Haloterrigena turkmenica]ADB63593.1 PilT protein domain protein [Haloterrigena turkmenica DSM 5511]
MNCLDSSFVIDYWKGEKFAKDFLESTTEPIGIPTVALFELYVGALLSDSPAEDIASVRDDLDWVEPLAFDDMVAAHAARIEATLRNQGEPINMMDVLIAATARKCNARVIATDSDFERVPDLDVYNPQGG